MAKQKNAKKKSGFMGWYESYSGKRVTGIIYSVGASVVIIGALFKILHWPGASQVLMIGMLTEAFLFIIGSLDKPHPTYHWQEVFPQLVDKWEASPDVVKELDGRPCPTLLGGGSVGGDGSAVQAVSMPGASVQANVISQGVHVSAGSVSAAVTNAADVASQLSKLEEVVSKNKELNDKMVVACEATDKYIASQESLAAISQTFGQQFVDATKALNTNASTLNDSYNSLASNMQEAVEASSTFRKNMASLSGGVNGVLSIYEVQVRLLEDQNKLLKEQVNSLETVNKDVDKLRVSSNEVLSNTESYKNATALLSSQISQLNSIYGNMLNALAKN